MTWQARQTQFRQAIFENISLIIIGITGEKFAVGQARLLGSEALDMREGHAFSAKFDTDYLVLTLFCTEQLQQDCLTGRIILINVAHC